METVKILDFKSITEMVVPQRLKVTCPKCSHFWTFNLIADKQTGLFIIPTESLVCSECKKDAELEEARKRHENRDKILKELGY